MVNSILNAVTKQLGTTFGNSYRYYLEDVEQGLQKPCFTVDVLIPLQRSKSAVLYDRTIPIVVHYFSDSKTDIKKKSYTLGEHIVECLEYLPVGRFNLNEDKLGSERLGNAILRGEDISWQLVDDVLQVFVTYKFTTAKVLERDENIETFEHNVNTQIY